VDSSALARLPVRKPTTHRATAQHVWEERAIRLAVEADAEVIGPPAEHAVQLFGDLGYLPGTRARKSERGTVRPFDG